jgi:deoxyadenosine/deoxycytidine kinase
MLYILGSIGAGKTTLTQMLAKDMGVNAYYEDVNNGLVRDMLEEFYSAGIESRKRVSAMLQVAFLTVRFQQALKAVRERNAILDSNLTSDFIMCTHLYKRGEMDYASYKAYMALNQIMQGQLDSEPYNGKPDVIVYLDIDPEHELDEIQRRGRDMEDVRKDPKLVDYYHSVNRAYKDWAAGGDVQAPLVTIQRDKYDFVNSVEDRNVVLNKIEQVLVDYGKFTQDEFEKIKADRAEKFGDPITTDTDAQKTVTN